MRESITINELYFKYAGDSSPVLNYVSAEIPKEQITLVLGSSGCGKSTLLYCFNGLIPNSIEGEIRGSIYIDNENIIGKKPNELCKRVGLVFQNPEDQISNFLVEDEILFSMENLNYDKETMEKSVVKCLNMVGMQEHRYDEIDKLSGGQKQKIVIASVLALDPEILIFDEPTANLDPKNSEEIFDLIYELKTKYNKTIIIIEHKLDYLINYVDKIILLDSHGKVDIQGDVQTVFKYIIENKRKSIFLPEITRLFKENKKIYLTVDEAVESIKDSVASISITANEKKLNSEDVKDKLLEVKNFSFSYKQGQAFYENFSLTINEGDFLGIIGQNGAGKSTLVKGMLDLLPNASGEILFKKENIKKWSKKQLFQNVGLVFQNPESQFVSYTVYDEVAYSLKSSGLANEEVSSIVEKHLRNFGLYENKDKSPYLLSQGQKRRLSVASMLVTNQKLLFLDEPTFGQDYENNHELAELMRNLNKNGITIVIITHDMNLISQYCNRVVVLNKGRIDFDGEPRELFLNKDLLEKNNLKRPPVLELSLELRKYMESFPVTLSFSDMINYIRSSLC